MNNKYGGLLMKPKYNQGKSNRIRNDLLKKTDKFSAVTEAVRSVFVLYDDLLHDEVNRLGDGWKDQVAQDLHRWFIASGKEIERNYPGMNYQNALMTIREANLNKGEFDKLRGFLRKEIKRQVKKNGSIDSVDSVEAGVVKWRGEHLTQVAAELEKDIGEIELESMRNEFEREFTAREVVLEAQKDDFNTLCANLNLPTTSPPLQIASPDSNTNRLEADYRPEWRPFDFQKDKPSTSAQLVGGIALAGVATAVLLRKLFGKTPSEPKNDSPSPR